MTFPTSRPRRKARDEVTFRLDEGDDVRRDPESGSRERRVPRSFALSIPSSSVSAPPIRQRTNDSPPALTLKWSRDATASSPTRSAPSGQTRAMTSASASLDHTGTLSPSGPNSGSAATSPATHSPKISTSTACPTAAPGGQVRVGDRPADRVAVAPARDAPDEPSADAHGLRAERHRRGIGQRRDSTAARRLAPRPGARRARRIRPCRA